MSLVGFDHVFATAQPVQLAPDLTLKVISSTGLMLLKIVAFMDDSRWRVKDLDDGKLAKCSHDTALRDIAALVERGILGWAQHQLLAFKGQVRINDPTRKCEPLTALKRELSPISPFLQHALTHFLELGTFLDV
jgi:hypothetical protein